MFDDGVEAPTTGGVGSQLQGGGVSEEQSLGDKTIEPSPVADKETEVAETPQQETHEEEQLGRGRRVKQQSVLLKPFVTYSAQANTHHATPSNTQQSSGTCLHPLTDFVSYDRFSPSQQAFLASVMAEVEPKMFKEAVRDPRWNNSMGVEVDALEESNTWDITILPPGKHAIESKWVYKIKYNADGTVRRHKSRLVACGNRHIEGIDFTETFAHVVKMTTVRILLKVASVKGWELHQMDVQNAFLHGDLEEEVYMKLPPGFKSTHPNQVCKLKKSLYGLRQAPRCWFAKLSTALLDFGFRQDRADYSLFTYVSGASVLYVLVYVDDLIIGGSDPQLTSKFMTYLSECFHMTDLGPLKYFLGLEVSCSKQGIYVCQRKYALDVISDSGMLGAQPVDFPMEQNHNLAKDAGEVFRHPDKYRRLVGRLVYLVITRPELSYAVHTLAQFMQTPRTRHWEAALRVIRYLKGSP